MLILAAVALVAMPDWVPARWFSQDPATLKLVESTPVNCLLIEKPWSPEFTKAAAERGIATLGVVPGNVNVADIEAEAKKAGLTGLAVNGASGKIDMPIVDLGNRSEIRFDSDAKILATTQGMWPGIRAEREGATAAPTSAPWIDTNTSFLRSAHVSTRAAIWIANRVPAKVHPLVTAYLAAIGDAEMTGARWVLDFDEDFARGLVKGDATALKNWALIVQHVRFYEDHKEWRGYSMRSAVALSSKRTHSKMAVNVEPELLSANDKEVLKAFMKAGGTLFMGRAGWSFPSPKPDQIVLDKMGQETIDSIWKELDMLSSHGNLGTRLFNVGSMLSNLLESPDGKKVALELVNYSDYPVADITVRLLGKFKTATLWRPDASPQKLDVYEVEEGTGVDVPALGSLGTIVLEP